VFNLVNAEEGSANGSCSRFRNIRFICMEITNLFRAWEHEPLVTFSFGGKLDTYRLVERVNKCG
jgi:hypothetical protein